MLITSDLKSELLHALDHATKGCKIQHDGWTCGTCFFAIDEKFNNRDWQTVLAVRGDTDSTELNNLGKLEDIPKRVNKIIAKCYAS